MKKKKTLVVIAVVAAVFGAVGAVIGSKQSKAKRIKKKIVIMIRIKVMLSIFQKKINE